jgi:hypothetical protein
MMVMMCVFQYDNMCECSTILWTRPTLFISTKYMPLRLCTRRDDPDETRRDVGGIVGCTPSALKWLTFGTKAKAKAGSPQHNFLTSYFYRIKEWYMYILLKYSSRWIHSYIFHIVKLNNLRFIRHLYFRGLTRTLSKTSIISIRRE